MRCLSLCCDRGLSQWRNRWTSLVRSLVLWHPTDSKMAVVHLVTSVDGLQDVATAVTSTELLPDEDPSLLTGPDRVQTQQVLRYLDTRPSLTKG